MIIVEYAKHGIPNADLESEWLARQIYNRYISYRSELDYTYQTSTESLVTAFRMLIAEGVISHEEIQFEFDGEILKPLPDGQLEKFTKGFCDAELDMMFRIIKTRINIDKN